MVHRLIFNNLEVDVFKDVETPDQAMLQRKQIKVSDLGEQWDDALWASSSTSNTAGSASAQDIKRRRDLSALPKDHALRDFGAAPVCLQALADASVATRVLQRVCRYRHVAAPSVVVLGAPGPAVGLVGHFLRGGSNGLHQDPLHAHNASRHGLDDEASINSHVLATVCARESSKKKAKSSKKGNRSGAQAHSAAGSSFDWGSGDCRAAMSLSKGVVESSSLVTSNDTSSVAATLAYTVQRMYHWELLSQHTAAMASTDSEKEPTATEREEADKDDKDEDLHEKKKNNKKNRERKGDSNNRVGDTGTALSVMADPAFSFTFRMWSTGPIPQPLAVLVVTAPNDERTPLATWAAHTAAATTSLQTQHLWILVLWSDDDVRRVKVMGKLSKSAKKRDAHQRVAARVRAALKGFTHTAQPHSAAQAAVDSGRAGSDLAVWASTCYSWLASKNLDIESFKRNNVCVAPRLQ